MKKIITLLALIIALSFAEAAAAHFYEDDWFVNPLRSSIWLVMLMHCYLLVSAIIVQKNKVHKDEK